MKRTSIAAQIVLACLTATTVGSAHAELVTFKFSARVTEVDSAFLNGTVAAGSTLQGSFSWNTDMQPLWASSSPGIASYGVPTSITATVNGHTISGQGLNVYVFDNTGGNVEDLLDVSASAPVVNGKRYVDGSFGLRLGSQPGHTNGLVGTALPSVLDLAKLDNPYFTYGQLRAHGAQGGQLLGFQVESVTAVPETNTAAMALAGLLSAGLVLVRRKT
jgi:hypothetical protein